MNKGLCPKCNAKLSNVNAEDVSIDMNFERKWRGLSFSCPSCHAVLSVQLNPILLREELLTEIATLLRNPTR
jgi:hypothetical protein